MSGDLERRYRRLLMLLPKDYRESRSEEMVGTCLDAADQEGTGRSWPDLREVLSLAALALRVRAGAAAATGRARSATPEVARLVALFGAFYLGVLGINAFADTSVDAHGPFRPVWVPSSSVSHPSLVAALHGESQILWVLVFVALAAGMRRTGAVLALFEACVTSATATSAAVAWDMPLIVVVIVAARMGPARRPAAGRRAGWLSASALMLAVGVCNITDRVLPAPGVRLDRVSALVAKLPAEPLWFGTGVLIAVAAVACLGNLGSAAWPFAMAVVGTQPMLVQVERMIDQGYFFHDRQIELVWLFEICLVTAVAVRVLLNRRKTPMRGGLA